MPENGFYGGANDNITNKGVANLWKIADDDDFDPSVVTCWGAPCNAGQANFKAGTWAQIVRTYSTEDSADDDA